MLLLEYLKVILTAPVLVVVAVVTFFVMFRSDIRALMARTAKVRFPGGEIETSQLEQLRKEEALPPKGDVPKPAETVGGTFEGLRVPASSGDAVAALAAERARAALWEYRYLNIFLARHTQYVLDWLAAATTRVTVSLYNAVWLPLIFNADERVAILTALQAHHLIAIKDDFVEVTPKGREYIQWRGPLPSPIPVQ